MKINKYTRTKTPDNPMLLVFYNATRDLLSMVTEEDAEERIENLKGHYQEAIDYFTHKLKKDASRLGVDSTKIINEFIADLSKEKYHDIIELALKDHKNKHGNRKITSWETM